MYDAGQHLNCIGTALLCALNPGTGMRESQCGLSTLAAGLAVHAPVNTRHCDSVGLMLSQQRRRWTNTKPTLAQCNVLAGMHTAGGEYKATPTQCLLNVGPTLMVAFHTLDCN